MQCYNFHSFVESLHFNEIHQFTTFQINSFYSVISVEDFRRVWEFQIEKYKDSDYQIKLSKQVLLKEGKYHEMKQLIDTFWIKIHLIVIEIYLNFISSNFYLTIIKTLKLMFY